MLINRFNGPVRRFPATAQLPWKITQLTDRIQSALSPAMQQWVAKQAQKIVRDRRNMLLQQMRLRSIIRATFPQSSGIQSVAGPQSARTELMAELSSECLELATLIRAYSTLGIECQELTKLVQSPDTVYPQMIELNNLVYTPSGGAALSNQMQTLSVGSRQALENEINNLKAQMQSLYPMIVSLQCTIEANDSTLEQGPFFNFLKLLTERYQPSDL